jgi:alkylhydroperoxidase/carboxymuconolactone decarboxylase family protein YurZ
MAHAGSDLTEEQQRIKQQFRDARGYWIGGWDDLLRLDQECFERYSELATHPWKAGTLDARMRELVLVAVNSATTHLNADATRAHVGNALDEGATVAEVLEVFQLTATLGIHSVSLGVDTLSERVGFPSRTDAQREVMAQVKADWESYLNDDWDDIMAYDHGFLDTFMRFSSHPWRDGPLSPGEKELVYIAIDASTTHLYEQGLGFHIDHALSNTDVTPEQIMEVFELVSDLGMQTLTEGVPILVEEAAGRDMLPEDF